MGYSFEFDPCDRPLAPHHRERALPHPRGGWHHAPGDGNFEALSTSGLKASAVDAGKSIDTAGCVDIEDDDIREHEFEATCN